MPHILMLAEQATEQLAQLVLTVDTQMSLDTVIAPESEEDMVEVFAPPEQMAVLQRSVKIELRRQVRALGHSIDAIYACAVELQRRRK